MPMGIVSDSEFETEVNNSSRIKSTEKPVNPVIEGEVVDLPNKGRSTGDNNVPDSLRKIIGETSEIEGRKAALELAEQFGISDSSVSAYSNGSTSTSSYNDQPNLEHINQSKERISKKARERLIKSLDHITDDKLVDAKPEVLANVARSMSAIVKEMEPEKPKEDIAKNGPTFIMYSPTFRKEEHFEHVFVQDKQ